MPCHGLTTNVKETPGDCWRLLTNQRGHGAPATLTLGRAMVWTNHTAMLPAPGRCTAPLPSPPGDLGASGRPHIPARSLCSTSHPSSPSPSSPFDPLLLVTVLAVLPPKVTLTLGHHYSHPSCLSSTCTFHLSHPRVLSQHHLSLSSQFPFPLLFSPSLTVIPYFLSPSPFGSLFHPLILLLQPIQLHLADFSARRTCPSASTTTFISAHLPAQPSRRTISSSHHSHSSHLASLAVVLHPLHSAVSSHQLPALFLSPDLRVQHPFASRTAACSPA